MNTESNPPELTSVERAIAVIIDSWEHAPAETALRYATAVATDAINPARDIADIPGIVAELGYRIGERGSQSGWSWTLDAEAWEIGVGSLHALADGVVENMESGTHYGTRTDIHAPWLIDPDCLAGTGLSVETFAVAYAGDLRAAAGAFLHACGRTML